MFGSSFIAGLILTFIGVNVAIDAFEVDLIVATNAVRKKLLIFIFSTNQRPNWL